MARMFPEHLPASVTHDPGRRAEAVTYSALQSLPDRIRVFYSVAFLDRRGDRTFDGEADFVLLDPDRGLLAVEVKGGGIARDPSTGRWTSTDRRGVRHDIAPFEQARRARRALLEKVKLLPRFSGRFIDIGHGVVFPDASRSGRQHLGPDGDLEIVAFAEDLPALGAKVDTMYAATAPSAATLQPADLDVLTDYLSPSVTLEVSVAEMLRRAERRIVELTDQQLALLDVLARQRRAHVLGGAGSGKTALALHKARRLADEGFRTLLTCFNRPLGDLLAAETEGVEGLTAMNYHRLCNVLGDRAALPRADPSGPRGFAALSDRLMDALDRLPEERFDALVVDEAQDMREGWWTALQLCLRDADTGVIYAFGDDAQRLLHDEEPGGAPPPPSDAPKLPQYLLGENLRNTAPIHALSVRFCPRDPPESGGPDGPEVDLVELTDGRGLARELGRVLHRLIREDGLAAGDVAVLTGRSLARSALGPAPERVGAFALTHDARAHGDAVLVETAWRFKGLERKAIVLCELEDYLDNDALLYSAITRARVRLVVVGSPETLGRLSEAGARGRPQS